MLYLWGLTVHINNQFLSFTASDQLCMPVYNRPVQEKCERESMLINTYHGGSSMYVPQRVDYMQNHIIRSEIGTKIPPLKKNFPGMMISWLLINTSKGPCDIRQHFSWTCKQRYPRFGFADVAVKVKNENMIFFVFHFIYLCVMFK